MKSFAKTDVGIKRTTNQDYVYSNEGKVGSFHNLFIVADGMGGHKAGDHASRLCVETLVDNLRNSEYITPVSMFEDAIEVANKAVYDEARTNIEYDGMGTTLVACTEQEDKLYIANIGDSRLYMVRDGIVQITTDHSLVEEMVKQGNITHSEARVHPQKNIITRALGINEEVQADFYEVDIRRNDVILMCSDGLSNMVEDDTIEYIIKHRESIEQAGEALVKAANDNGGSDNITVILVEI